MIEHGGGGSKVAAPIAKDVMTLTLQRDPTAKRAFVPTLRTAGGATAAS